MRVAVFFLCLCFLLLRGDAPAFAAAQGADSYQLIETIDQHPETVLTTPEADHPALNQVKKDAELTYFIADELEDEDSNNLTAQRDRLPVSIHPLTTYQSYPGALHYQHNRFKTLPFFFRPVSDKYILLRVLRI